MSLSKHVICEPRSFKLAFQNDATVNIKEINDEILDSVSKYSIKAVLGYTKKGRAVTFEELAKNGITDDLAGTDEEVLKVLTFDFKDGEAFRPGPAIGGASFAAQADGVLPLLGRTL